MSVVDKFEASLKKLPVVAIIRGVRVDEVVEVAHAIYEGGVSIIEVPLNTPNAFECIRRLADAMQDKCSVGCGTLVKVGDVARLVDVGAELAVTPSTQPEVIEACIEQGLLPMPGWMTPSEAFSAVHAGARYLKLFPASTAGVGHIKALKAVLPEGTELFAVGGVKLDEIALWKAAGARGFGFGSEIFAPGISAEEVLKRTRKVTSIVSDVYAS